MSNPRSPACRTTRRTRRISTATAREESDRAACSRLSAIASPELLAAAQEIDNQVILRGEIPVQRHLRRAGPGDDGIDSHRPDTIAAEQLVRGPAYPLAPAVLPLVR